jgi:NADH:ubiquinone reductase (H+-translocating)
MGAIGRGVSGTQRRQETRLPAHRPRHGYRGKARTVRSWWTTQPVSVSTNPADLNRMASRTAHTPSSESPSLPHIVVVGGGAGGLELVTRLGDTIGRRKRAQITLVERSRTHLWKPLLHAVAAGSMNPGEHELDYLAQAHWHHFRYRFGEMVGLDRDRRAVCLAPAYDDEGRQITPAQTLPYDTLVIAVGSVTNDFGTPGVFEYSVPLETPEQAARFNRRVVNACIRAHTQDGPVRAGQLHVAIIGAGATGTELAAELHRTVREVVAFGLDRVDPDKDIRIILIEASDRILPALPSRISDATLTLLKRLGVEVRTGAMVREVTTDGIRLADGEFVPSELVVWAAGVRAPEVLRDIGGLETNRLNQLVVTSTLQTTRDPNIFVIGDCAECPRAGYSTAVPPRAQAAHQQSSHLVRQLRRQLDHRLLEPFVYRDFGSLVSLGRYSTVGSLMGFLVGRSFFIEGYVAKTMYRSLYLMHEIALQGTWKTLIEWTARGLSRRAEPQVKLH